MDLVSNDSYGGPDENVEEYFQIMFDQCRLEDGKLSVKMFLEEIEKSGIRITDPRLEQLLKRLESLKPHSLNSVDELKLDTNTFKSIFSENIVLVNKAFQNHLVLPDFEAFCDVIRNIFEELKLNHEGKSSDYIPQLSQYGAEKWGLSICTVDGQRFALGDADEIFTIQAIGQVILYAICLNELGQETVHRYEGREPSGRTFNEIVLDHQNLPHNPLVNSGGIMSAALILGLVQPHITDIASKYDYVFSIMQQLAGGEHLGFNNSAFLSERDNSDRNFAITYFMSENKCFPEGVDIKKALDLYLQISSIEVSCESGSVIASTFANDGVCPITGRRVFKSETVQHALSLMYSCGMYNYSGQFAFEVGLPSKSGLSGVMMVVVPNVMGITLWSPPLDRFKNPVRGTEFCKKLVNLYRFHRFDSVGGQGLTTKIDPTFTKRPTTSESVVQILLAAAAGDKLALQQAWLRDIDLNMADYDGRAPLHLAAANGRYECAYFLLKTAKVDPCRLDRWNRTPLDEAIYFHHHLVAALIKNHLKVGNRKLSYSEDDFDEDKLAVGQQENAARQLPLIKIDLFEDQLDDREAELLSEYYPRMRSSSGTFCHKKTSRTIFGSAIGNNQRLPNLLSRTKHHSEK